MKEIVALGGVALMLAAASASDNIKIEVAIGAIP